MNIEKGLLKDDIPSISRMLWEKMSRKWLTLVVESRGNHFSFVVALAKYLFLLVLLGILPVPLNERINHTAKLSLYGFP
jgi:hypothetical protein